MRNRQDRNWIFMMKIQPKVKNYHKKKKKEKEEKVSKKNENYEPWEEEENEKNTLMTTRRVEFCEAWRAPPPVTTEILSSCEDETDQEQRSPRGKSTN